MKNYKKILLLLLGILIIAGTTYAWKAGGGVKWIGESTENQKDNRFEDHSSDTTYGTGYYLDTYTNLKWQAHDTTPSDWNGTGHKPKWASGSTDSDDDNYLGEYLEPVWDGNNYTYNPPVGYSADDYEAFKYCESIGDGHWRLPTKREIFSIMTDTKPSGMNYYTALPSISHKTYRSSTNRANSPRWAWLGESDNGGNGYAYKSIANFYTICIHD